MEWKNRIVLITGATGFIGGHLVNRLRTLGATVHTVSRSKSLQEGIGLHSWQLDLADASATNKLVDKVSPQVVFHLASLVTGGRDLELVLPTLNANLVGAVNLMTALTSSGCGRLVLAGSMEEPDSDQGSLIPSSPYAAAKWASSGYARMFHALYDTQVVTARIFMVYGPNQIDTKKLIPYVTLGLLRGKVPHLMSGERPVDWIYVDDVVEGLMALADNPDVAGQRVDLGTGQLVKVRDVVETLCRISETEIQPQFGAVSDRAMEQVRVANIEATQASIGWKPRNDLEKGLRETYRWYAGELSDGRIEA